jgi:excisionase family DNA binding protein
MTTMIRKNKAATKEFFTVKEVAEYLNIHDKQVYLLVKKKRIPATRITGKWLFPKKLIKEWIVASARQNVAADSFTGNIGLRLALNPPPVWECASHIPYEQNLISQPRS